MPSEHIHSLDSVRGLAALSVLFQHSLIVFPVFLAALFLHPTHSWAMWILTHTPLHFQMVRTLRQEHPELFTPEREAAWTRLAVAAASHEIA